MSFTAEGWAWEQKCPSSSAKLVLVCLGWFANKEGSSAFPSIATICKRTQLVERAVRKALADLIAARLIFPALRPGDDASKRHLSTEYCLALGEQGAANQQDSPVAEGMLISRGEDCELAGGGDANQQGNPSLNHQLKEEDSPLPPKGRAPTARMEAEGWVEFWDRYPRKVGKGAAFKAYLRAVKAAGDYNDVLGALVDASWEDRRFTGDPQYIPHPTTWLNAGDWHAPKAKTNGHRPPVMEALHAH
jgi:hypothetical protein